MTISNVISRYGGFFSDHGNDEWKWEEVGFFVCEKLPVPKKNSRFPFFPNGESKKF